MLASGGQRSCNLSRRCHPSAVDPGVPFSSPTWLTFPKVSRFQPISYVLSSLIRFQVLAGKPFNRKPLYVLPESGRKCTNNGRLLTCGHLGGIGRQKTCRRRAFDTHLLVLKGSGLEAQLEADMWIWHVRVLSLGRTTSFNTPERRGRAILRAISLTATYNGALSRVTPDYDDGVLESLSYNSHSCTHDFVGKALSSTAYWTS